MRDRGLLGLSTGAWKGIGKKLSMGRTYLTFLFSGGVSAFRMRLWVSRLGLG